MSIPFCLIKTHCCSGRLGQGSGHDARERFLIAPLTRSQGERHRRLALASGFPLLRLVRSSPTSDVGDIAASRLNASLTIATTPRSVSARPSISGRCGFGLGER
jgi:hypothetical protein